MFASQVILLSVLGISFGVLFYCNFRWSRRAQLIARTSTTKIADASPGGVEIEGSVGLLGGKPVIAPMSGSECAWYQYARYKRSSAYSVSGGDSWELIDKGECVTDILIEDESGCSLVKAQGAEFNHISDLTWYSDKVPPTGSPLVYKMLVGKGKYRYEEKLIFPKEKVYVLGEFRTNVADERTAYGCDSGAAGVVGKPDSVRHPFIITLGASQKEMTSSYLYWGRLARLGMLVMVGGAIWVLYFQGI